MKKEEFIKRAKEIHGDKYDYTLVDYKNNKTKVKIICKIHGIFEVRPDNHYHTNCPKCNNRKKLKTKWNIENFIEKSKEIHSNKYDYSLVDYKNKNIKVKIICPIHGQFEQAPSAHLSGNGCSLCSKNKKYTKERLLTEFKNLHNDKYEYEFLEKHNLNSYINVFCKNHGWFKQKIRKHLIGRGCKICNMSSSENIIRKFLIENNINFKKNKTFDDCIYKQPLYFDFYLPDKNMIIEFDGEQHYIKFRWEKDDKELKIRKIRDEIKNQYCHKNNIDLLRIKWNENLLEKLKILI